MRELDTQMFCHLKIVSKGHEVNYVFSIKIERNNLLLQDKDWRPIILSSEAFDPARILKLGSLILNLRDTLTFETHFSKILQLPPNSF
jgi:hypothetical protein